VERLGRYQLLDKLGQGGMGTVYLARDTRLDRCVALKVLPPESVHDPDAVARFQREARALARLSHPGIVQVYDSEEDNGRHFLAMEYVEGQSLAAVLKEKGRLPPTLAADYLHQALLAVQHAHEKGLVHRDLKPSNLLLTPEGKVKVLDLGLARFLQDQIGDANRTREGVGMGTPDYAAPEQFRDAHSADARADVYALGCTLYCLIAGQVPFPGSSLAEKRQAHFHKEPAPLEELCPEAPAGLILVVRRMMAKQPGDRFQSAAEAAEALAPYVTGFSTSTWRGSRPAMPALTSRRLFHWAVAAIVAAALVLVVALAWSGWFRPGTSAPGTAGPAALGDGNEKAKPVVDDPDLLTVSKDIRAGGKYRTINEALAKVRPRQTIRVLDREVYQERISLKSPSRHEGITLEASAARMASTIGRKGPKTGVGDGWERV
jgi:hypothetical protein